mgnify:CR=1 FL=1
MAAGLQIQIYCNRSVIGKTIRYIDLFSGIGGFREGLTRAGGFTCIGHCEIDEKANRSYETLFDTKGEWFCEDIKKAAEDLREKADRICE